MRRYSHSGRKDHNHAEVVDALRKIGCAIIDISELGGGVPDLIVGFRGIWHVIEIKNPKTQYGRKGLNANQIEWADKQHAEVKIVRSPEEAVRYITA